ncbi:hypothetical protein V8C86DRAFT_2496777 [Haematococcus lacustris]
MMLPTLMRTTCLTPVTATRGWSLHHLTTPQNLVCLHPQAQPHLHAPPRPQPSNTPPTQHAPLLAAWCACTQRASTSPHSLTLTVQPPCPPLATLQQAALIAHPPTSPLPCPTAASCKGCLPCPVLQTQPPASLQPVLWAA